MVVRPVGSRGAGSRGDPKVEGNREVIGQIIVFVNRPRGDRVEVRRGKSKVDARGAGRVNVVVVCDRAGVNYKEVIVGERVKERFAGGAAVLATPRNMVAVEVDSKEDGIIRGNGLQEIVKVKSSGESGWGAVDKN